MAGGEGAAAAACGGGEATTKTRQRRTSRSAMGSVGILEKKHGQSGQDVSNYFSTLQEPPLFFGGLKEEVRGALEGKLFYHPLPSLPSH